MSGAGGMSGLERQLVREARELRPGAPSLATLDAFVGRAEGEGLIDVAYAQADSPLGPLTVAATDAGLVTLAYPDRTVDEVLAGLARKISPRILDAPARLEPVRRQLDEYFAGERREFDFPIDWRLTAGGFFGKILRATARIDYGETITYRQVAERAGNVKAVRAAGNGLGSNPIPIVVPCHRVVASGGGMGGYTGGIERKQFLLALERGERELAPSA
jgi:methylated-DNA-[protein]-cysteine S-methyltransferase